MRRGYTRKRHWFKTDKNAFYYDHPAVSWFCRYPRSAQANRRANSELNDDELLSLKIYPRGRRRKVPTAYDDLPKSRRLGKSWKDFTRRRRQWE